MYISVLTIQNEENYKMDPQKETWLQKKNLILMAK